MAMHLAARENEVEELQRLIISGKHDVNEKDSMRRTPLHIASWAGHAEIVEVLLRSKAKTDALANDNFTALHFAKNVDTIKALVKSNRALLSARISKGNKTALHLAVPKGNLDVVRCLIDLGSDVTAKTSNGQSCLELAKSDEMYAYIKETMQSKIEKQQEAIDRKVRNAVENDTCNTAMGVQKISQAAIITQADTEDVKIHASVGASSSSAAKISSSPSEEHIMSLASGHAIASGDNFVTKDAVQDVPVVVPSQLPSLLGIKSKPLTALERRKKKVKESAGSAKLSHLHDEEDGDEDGLGS